MSASCHSLKYFFNYLDLLLIIQRRSFKMIKTTYAIHLCFYIWSHVALLSAMSSTCWTEMVQALFPEGSWLHVAHCRESFTKKVISMFLPSLRMRFFVGVTRKTTPQTAHQNISSEPQQTECNALNIYEIGGEIKISKYPDFASQASSSLWVKCKGFMAV